MLIAFGPTLNSPFEVAVLTPSNDHLDEFASIPSTTTVGWSPDKSTVSEAPFSMPIVNVPVDWSNEEPWMFWSSVPELSVDKSTEIVPPLSVSWRVSPLSCNEVFNSLFASASASSTFKIIVDPLSIVILPGDPFVEISGRPPAIDSASLEYKE